MYAYIDEHKKLPNTESDYYPIVTPISLGTVLIGRKMGDEH